MNQLDNRALLLWMLPGILMVGLSSLACGLVADCEPATDSTCQDLDPVTARNLAQVNDLLLGQWEIGYDLTDRTEADRPMLAAQARWNLELLQIDPPSTYGDQNFFYWTGALQASSLCVVTTEDFNNLEPTCTPLENIDLGQCSGHDCTAYPEVELTGSYRVDTGEFTIDDPAVGDMFHLDPQFGLLRLDVDLYRTWTLEGEEASGDECGNRGCSWRINTYGALAQVYEGYSSYDFSHSLRRTRKGARQDRAVDSEPVQFQIGDQEELEALLLGPWSLTMTLGDTDAVEREFVFGQVRYTLDLFEVERSSQNPGLWLIKGGLRANSACLTPQAQIEAGAFQCEEYAPMGMGRCNAEGCDALGERGVEGNFNAFTGEMDLAQADASAYFLDDGRGYINLDLSLAMSDGLIMGQRLEAHQCQRSCSWTSRGAGAYDEDFPYRSAYDITLEMTR
jgi:hypothetical protein